jgi:hypothetical protein
MLQATFDRSHSPFSLYRTESRDVEGWSDARAGPTRHGTHLAVSAPDRKAPTMPSNTAVSDKRRGRRMAALSAAAFAMLLLVSGCTPASRKPETVVMVLFDTSGSTHDQQIREQYTEDFKTVVDTVANSGGVLLGDVIDSDPFGHASLPINTQFSKFNSWTDSRTQHAAESARLENEVLDTASEVLATQPTGPGTDLFSALRLAERTFGNYPTANKTLVIFSDMFQQTSSVDFTTGNIGAYERLFTATASNGSVANLAHVNVYAVGAGSNTGTVDAARNIAIEHFWSAYFRRAGASLTDAHYNSRLIRFDA